MLNSFPDDDELQEREPDDNNVRQTMNIFGSEMTTTELSFAMALVSSVGFLDDALKAIHAAWALQNVVGRVRPAESVEARDWNRHHGIGQLVHVCPELASPADIEQDERLKNAEPFLTRTESPAFETDSGSYLLVQNYRVAIPLRLIQASSVRCPEVAARYF